VREGLIQLALIGCAAFSILTTFAIIFVLFGETFRFFQLDDVTFLGFITGTEWNPLLGAQQHFGIWPLIFGTLQVTVIAMLVALPLGFLTAIFLSEYAPRKLRTVLKPVLEVLAGVPTVVYGFFALTVITPALRSLWSGFEVYNATSAGLAVGIMCLPIVTSLTEDALQAVPRSLREGAYAVGGTKFDVTLRVVYPAALSGAIAASLLAVARAVGETMIVALAAGNLPTSFESWTDFGGMAKAIDPTTQTQTMTAFMVQIFLGDASNFGPEYFASYAVGAALFVMTMIFTIIGHRVRVRFREVYE
jgi:phosphate transport system permease protein